MALSVLVFENRRVRRGEAHSRAPEGDPDGGGPAGRAGLRREEFLVSSMDRTEEAIDWEGG